MSPTIESAINGVIFKELVTHTDERGFFREILRNDDAFFDHSFGQWSQSLMHHGIVKAWHWHKKQTDYFYVASGVVRVGLYDQRADSKTHGQTLDFLLGDHQKSYVVKIPPGVVHGVKAAQGPAILMYLMSHVYDPSDEHRIAHDDPKIGFDWLSGPEIR